MRRAARVGARRGRRALGAAARGARRRLPRRLDRGRRIDDRDARRRRPRERMAAASARASSSPSAESACPVQELAHDDRPGSPSRARGQCGPCSNGLPAIAGLLAAMAAGRAPPDAHRRLERWSRDRARPRRLPPARRRGALPRQRAARLRRRARRPRARGPCRACGRPPTLVTASDATRMARHDRAPARRPDRLHRPRALRRAVPGVDRARRLGLPDRRPRPDPRGAARPRAPGRGRLPEARASDRSRTSARPRAAAAAARSASARPAATRRLPPSAWASARARCSPMPVPPALRGAALEDAVALLSRRRRARRRLR